METIEHNGVQLFEVHVVDRSWWMPARVAHRSVTSEGDISFVLVPGDGFPVFAEVTIHTEGLRPVEMQRIRWGRLVVEALNAQCDRAVRDGNHPAVQRRINA